MKKILLIFTALLFLTSCENTKPQNQNQPSETLYEAELLNLQYNPELSQNPLITSEKTVLENAGLLYDTLFETNSDYLASPCLVASFSRKGLIYTFKLKDNLRFTDKTPITSAHAVNSINTC